MIKTQYSNKIDYGFLISQSIEPGTRLTEKDNKNIVLTYSLGRPYLGDLRGAMNEGELQKHFFDTYQSKGADVDYEIEYIHSDQPRGTIVAQSDYNTIIPLDYRVVFYISIGDGYDPSAPSISPDAHKDF